MKTEIILTSLIFMLLMASSLCAQNRKNIKEIEAYKNKLQEYIDNENKRESLSLGNIESITEIKKIFFKARKQDACRVKKEIILEYEADLEVLKQKHLSKNEQRKFISKKTIQDRFIRFIKKGLSRNERKVFESDYVIIGKVIDKKSETIVEGMLTHNKITCDVVIDNIIVGDTKINVTDTIKFSFGAHWFMNSEHNYLIGQKYLLNLEYRIDQENDHALCVLTYLDDNEEFYPVTNNEIYDKTNSYYLGEKISISNLDYYYQNLITKIYGEDIDE